MPEKPTGEWVEGEETPAVPVDDGARERLRAIVKFFDTCCDRCDGHYCEDCTARFTKLILEARDYLEGTTE